MSIRLKEYLICSPVVSGDSSKLGMSIGKKA